MSSRVCWTWKDTSNHGKEKLNRFYVKQLPGSRDPELQHSGDTSELELGITMGIEEKATQSMTS